MLGKNNVVVPCWGKTTLFQYRQTHEIRLIVSRCFIFPTHFSVSIHWNYIYFFPFYANFTIMGCVQQLLGQAVWYVELFGKGQENRWSDTCNLLPRQKHSSCSRNQSFSQTTVTSTIFHASRWILFLLANSMILSMNMQIIVPCKQIWINANDEENSCLVGVFMCNLAWIEKMTLNPEWLSLTFMPDWCCMPCTGIQKASDKEVFSCRWTPACLALITDT